MQLLLSSGSFSRISFTNVPNSPTTFNLDTRCQIMTTLRLESIQEGAV